MADVETQDNKVSAGSGEVPWTKETFDAERAGRLVTNLRAEIEGLKEQLRAAKADAVKAVDAVKRASDLEAENTALKEQVEASQRELADLKTVSEKEKILSTRGLPLNLVGALNGSKTADWEQMADMLASLRGGTEQPAFKPDPVQQDAVNSGGLSAEEALARQMGLL